MFTFLGRKQVGRPIYISIGIWGCITLILIFVHVQLFPYAEDDAYIHFRIAINLIDHGVPYFNVSDPVYATSSVSWTLLVSSIFKVITRDPHVIAIVNSLVTTAGAFLFKRLLQQLSLNSCRSLYYWFFVCLYVAQLAVSSIGLMETPFALLLLVTGLLLLLSKNPWCFVAFWGMVFTRLEFLIVLPLVLVYCSFQKAFSYKVILRWCVISATPFVVFALYFWGTLVPNTVIAKQQVYSLSYLDVTLLLTNSLLPDFSYYAWELKAQPVYKFTCLMVLAVLIVYFIFSEIRTKPNDKNKGMFYLLLASGVAIMGAYALRKVLIFEWYIPLYVTPISFGLYGIVFLNKKLTRWVLIVAMTPWILSVLGNFSQTLLSVAMNDTSLYPNFSTGARVRKYIQLGEILYRKYPGATLMTSEIGGLGYSYPGYIFDGVGLISPQALQFHPMKVPEERSSGYLGSIPVNFVKLVKPDIIVSYDIFIQAFLRSELANQYVRIREPVFLDDDLQRSQSKQIWGSSNLYVFIRKDLIRENEQP